MSERLPVQQADMQHLDDLNLTGHHADESLSRMSTVEIALRAAHAVGSPRTELLLGLVQLNYLRAFVTNLGVLGFLPGELHYDALSVFSVGGAWHATRSRPQLPSCLEPTATQCLIPHHPWVDVLPSPQMRDNLIRAAGELDPHEFCLDARGRQSAQHGPSGVIVWGVPWDVKGWEVSGTFLRRWGWLLQDCWDLFQSTNYWRAQRGAGPISRAAWFRNTTQPIDKTT